MIPDSLQPILWSVNVDKLDLHKDKPYIIHQVLAYGTREHLHWLRKTYSLAELQKVFINSPAKDYVPASFNFIKNYFLKLADVNINPTNYVRTLRRYIGQ